MGTNENEKEKEIVMQASYILLYGTVGHRSLALYIRVRFFMTRKTPMLRLMIKNSTHVQINSITKVCKYVQIHEEFFSIDTDSNVTVWVR